jgi:hypothetical protein
MVAALAIRMDAHLAHSEGVDCRILEALAAVQAGDTSRVEGVSEIRRADLIEGSRSGGWWRW